MMVQLTDEISRAELIYKELHELAKSPVPVVQDSALLMLAIAVDLLKQIDPTRFLLNDLG